MAVTYSPLGNRVIFADSRDPGVNDDRPTIGAERGDQWENTATGDWFVCSSPAAGAALWRKLT